MTQQENLAGKELVVDSIRILKSNGFTGAGAVTYERKIDELEQKVTVVSKNQDRYSDISDDKTITSEEKQTLKKEVLVIDTEYPLFVRSAEAAGVTGTGEYRQYQTAYTSLEQYLNEYLHVFDDMEASTEIPSRSNFNAYFQVYYERRQQLQDMISRGYAESYSGLTDQNSIPVMELSAPVVMVTSYTEENPDYSEYEPGYITFYGLLRYGEESREYETRFKVFRNGDEVPVYQSSKPELSGSYVIPEGTTSLRVVMYDQLGNVIYDNEPIDFITPVSGNTLHLTNKYQTFYNDSVNQSRAGGNYFRTVIQGYKGLERRPVDLGRFPEVEGLSFRADGDTILIAPTAEIEITGEVTFNAFIELTDAEDGIVYGIGDGDDAIIIGMPDGQYDTIVMGEFDGETQEVVFDYANIEHEELRENLLIDTGKYLGYYYDYLQLPKAKNGDFILFVGQSIDGTIWKNGLTYKWNGVHWEIDNNPQHEMASITDALKVSQTLLNMDPNAMAVLLVNYLAVNKALINQLFANQIEISEGGHIAGNYVPGESGFYFGSDGSAELNNVVVRGVINSTTAHISGQSTFEGDIFSGPLVLSSEESEGATLTGLYRDYLTWETMPLILLLDQYDLIESKSEKGASAYFTSKKIVGISPYTCSYIKIASEFKASYGREWYENKITFYDNEWKLVGTKTTQDTQVSFKPIYEGTKTFKLIDIPIAPSAISGVVWCDTKDGNTLKLS